MKNQMEILTPEEKTLVYAFVLAAEALPENICITINDSDEEDPTLVLSKRLSRGHATGIIGLHKPSLSF